jgi:hypothetical protein
MKYEFEPLTFPVRKPDDEELPQFMLNIGPYEIYVYESEHHPGKWEGDIEGIFDEEESEMQYKKDYDNSVFDSREEAQLIALETCMSYHIDCMRKLEEAVHEHLAAKVAK